MNNFLTNYCHKDNTHIRLPTPLEAGNDFAFIWQTKTATSIPLHNIYNINYIAYTLKYFNNYFRVFFSKNFAVVKISSNFALEITPRGGAVVARWAHNPKVVGSSPAPATKKADSLNRLFSYHKIRFPPSF